MIEIQINRLENLACEVREPELRRELRDVAAKLRTVMTARVAVRNTLAGHTVLPNAPTHRMTVRACGQPREAYLACGWTDAQLLAHGYMEPTCPTCSGNGAVGNILTAEPCPDCTPTVFVGYINRGIAPHTQGKIVFHEKATRNLEARWWSPDEAVYTLRNTASVNSPAG